MRRLQKVKLWGGPLDGMRYSINTLGGKLPTSIFVNVASHVPEEVPAPRSAITPNTVEYVLHPGEPQYALEPTYRFRQR